jgi:hypothetical protein
MAENNNWYKRHALCMASQLPDNAADARAVLREVQDIVDTWLHVEPEPAPSKVLTLLRDKE